MNFNLLNVPSLFLYVDFFGPLFFLFIIIFLSFLIVKVLFKELTYKFLVDYLAKNSILKMKNLKFIDIFLNGLNSKGYSFLIINSFISNYYFKNLYFNRVVITVFLFFIICWGFSLNKICALQAQDYSSKKIFLNFIFLNLFFFFVI